MSWLMAAEPVSNAGEDVFVRYAAIIGAVLMVAITTTKKGREFLATWRAGSAEKDDSDIAELRREVTNVRTMLQAEQVRSAAYYDTVVQLYRYILEAQRDPTRLNEPVPKLPIDQMDR